MLARMASSRHTLWISDEDWAQLRQDARHDYVTVSELIRSRAIGHTAQGSTGPQLHLAAPPTPQSPSPELHAAFLRVAELTAEGRTAPLLGMFTAAPEYARWAQAQGPEASSERKSHKSSEIT